MIAINQGDEMLTVSELSKLAGVTPDAIRHYTHIGLLKVERRAKNGYRLFNTANVKHVKFIRRAQGLGFTLADIAIIFQHSEKGQSPCPAVRDIIHQRIDDNRSRSAGLNALQQRMDEALDKWKTMPDGEPDGNAICYLIESVTEPIE